MRLYIIGNGFDLFHRLPTSYEDFRKYLKSNDEKIYDYVMESYNTLAYPSNTNVFIGGLENSDSNLLIWNDFEKALGNLDEDVLWEYVNNNMNYNYENWKDDDNHIAQRLLDKRLTIITDNVKVNLASWICSIDVLKAQNRLKLSQDSLFLTFNYTKTLELYYSIPDFKVNHIHGSTDIPHKIITGHNILSQKRKNKFDDIRMIECDELIYKAFQNTRKPVERIIENNKDYFKSLCNIKEIHIIGHSLNEIDLPYFKEIVNNVPNNVEWFLFFKDKDDSRKNMKVKRNVLQSIGIDYRKINFKLIESYNYDPYRFP